MENFVKFRQITSAKVSSNQTVSRIFFKNQMILWEKILYIATNYVIYVAFPQCVNQAIFLPIRFYVKSILADFKRSKTAILIILEA